MGDRVTVGVNDRNDLVLPVDGDSAHRRSSVERHIVASRSCVRRICDRDDGQRVCCRKWIGSKRSAVADRRDVGNRVGAGQRIEPYSRSKRGVRVAVLVCPERRAPNLAFKLCVAEQLPTGPFFRKPVFKADLVAVGKAALSRVG